MAFRVGSTRSVPWSQYGTLAQVPLGTGALSAPVTITVGRSLLPGDFQEMVWSLGAERWQRTKPSQRCPGDRESQNAERELGTVTMGRYRDRAP